MHSSPQGKARKRVIALLCACAFGLLAAGCHNNNVNSGYGVAWISLTDEPGDFTTYIVTVSGLQLTGKTYGLITAISAPEAVDFTKLVKFRNCGRARGFRSIPIPRRPSRSITPVRKYTCR